MKELQSWLDQNQEKWINRFTTLIQVLTEPAEQLHPITYERARLKELNEDLQDQIMRNPMVGSLSLARLRQVVKQRIRYESETRTEHARLSSVLQYVQEMEPLLALLTIREGETIYTLEQAILEAAKMRPEDVLKLVRDELKWLIMKTYEAAREIINDEDQAYKIKVVQEEANARLALWFQANPVFFKSVQLTISPSPLIWIGLAIGVLVLTFAFPPVGIGLGVTLGVGQAYASVRNAIIMSRFRGTRLAQYGFKEFVTTEEIEAAITQAVVDVFFAVLDVAELGQTVKGFVLSAKLGKASARETAGALMRSLVDPLLNELRVFKNWPDELTEPIKQAMKDLEQFNPGWLTKLSLNPDDVTILVQKEMLSRYEWELVGFQIKFEKALEAGNVGDLEKWLLKEIPLPKEFLAKLSAPE